MPASQLRFSELATKAKLTLSQSGSEGASASDSGAESADASDSESLSASGEAAASESGSEGIHIVILKYVDFLWWTSM